MAGMSSGSAARTCTSSARIFRLLAIEDALERREMRAGVLARIGEEQAVGLAHDLVPDLPQRSAGRAGEHLQPAGPLQVVHQVERLGDRRPDNDDAVAGEEHYPLLAEHAGQAIAL